MIVYFRWVTMVSRKEDKVDFNKLEKEFANAVEADQRYWRENDAKLRAVQQKVATYDEFRYKIIKYWPQQDSVIVSRDPYWQMRRFWAIVSMDPYCRLCIHIPHYLHPSPDPNPKPNPNPKSYPNLKLFNE